ncbi:RIC1-domain-containing protein [Cyathus striatus]|nr:RIC1-domain-containing protein [Cyathus striatus]
MSNAAKPSKAEMSVGAPVPVIALSQGPRKSLFCTLTRNGVALWLVRPTTILAFLSRTPASILEHGENVNAWWSPDGKRIVIQVETVYNSPVLPINAQRSFLAGPGEGVPLQAVGLHFEGVIRTSPMFSTKNPPTIQRMPWPAGEAEDSERPVKPPMAYDTWILNEEDFPWIVEPDVSVDDIVYSRIMGGETWITSDGRGYLVQLAEDLEAYPSSSDVDVSTGKLYSKKITQKKLRLQRRIDPDELTYEQDRKVYEEPRYATRMSINANGRLEFSNFPTQEGVMPKPQNIQIPNPYNKETGEVCALEWSSDGYVLAVGWKHGWGIVSVGGRCLASAFGIEDSVDGVKYEFLFLLEFWAPGNFELVVLSNSTNTDGDGQLFVIPFAKSATTGQHSPDNTRYAFLQMDDRALVYRGADQPDMSVINPESDVWHTSRYLSVNWPIRYSSLSSDGRLIAVAGRKGLIHYSSTSGRWKLFADEQQEQAFAVRGGLVWFHHVLIAAVEVSKSYQIRLYSRDMELTSQNILHREILTSPVVILSLVDNSLLVYTVDNTLYHYLIVPTADSIKLHLCGAITFTGIIAAPSAVRMLSWMIPTAQKELGDPVDDLAVATVLMVVGGQLILLRPRKSAEQEVKYDMQIFAERIEFCWIHLRGIGSLENSLWAYDSQAVLMDKGIIIGAEHEAVTRFNLPFVMFRHATSSHLFLQHILLYHLHAQQVKEAVQFASHYKSLVFFAHALEILLHTVVEIESTMLSNGNSASPIEDQHQNPESILPTVIEFLDHFEVSLDVVVGCARKIEVTHWRRLFDAVGNPKSLFELCLASQRLRTAGSYLLVLHNLEQLEEDHGEVIRLLKSALEGKDWQLCRELLRFLHSIDDSGSALRNALHEATLGELWDQLGNA